MGYQNYWILLDVIVISTSIWRSLSVCQNNPHFWPDNVCIQSILLPTYFYCFSRINQIVCIFMNSRWVGSITLLAKFTISEAAGRVNTVFSHLPLAFLPCHSQPIFIDIFSKNQSVRHIIKNTLVEIRFGPAHLKNIKNR